MPSSHLLHQCEHARPESEKDSLKVQSGEMVDARSNGASGAKRDLIPIAIRHAMRDAMGGWGPYTVNEISELFIEHGFTDSDPSVSWGGQRTSEVESFHAAIDFTDPEEADRYLRVVEDVLDANKNEDRRAKFDKLTKALDRAGIKADGRGRLRLPSRVAPGLDPSKLPSESDIRMHIDRLERFDQEPEEMVGAAKELIEAVAKYVLIEMHEAIDPSDDVASLVKKAMMKLRLHKDAMAPDTKGAETIVRILGGLQQIAIGLAELRNLGYGTGHGQGRRAGVTQRHGELAARVAIAHALFVLDTLADHEAPWRKDGTARGTPSATIEPR